MEIADKLFLESCDQKQKQKNKWSVDNCYW